MADCWRIVSFLLDKTARSIECVKLPGIEALAIRTDNRARVEIGQRRLSELAVVLPHLYAPVSMFVVATHILALPLIPFICRLQDTL